MRGLREYYLTRSKREKALICVVVFLAVVVLLHYSDVMPPFSNQEMESELREKAVLLRKFQALLGREKIIKAEASSGSGHPGGANLIKVAHEGQILMELPRLLKRISAQNDVVLSKSNIIQKEVLCKEPLLLRLEMVLEITAIPKAEKLQKLLYQFENSEDFTCYIKEMKLKELPGSQGVNLSATLDTFAIVEK